jgi:hypothetical protein
MAALTLTEDAVHRLAPDDDAVRSARSLVKDRKYLNTGASADGSWLLGQCKGSGAKPYQVSVDFAEPSNPVVRCSCPSRKQPCKHGLGLLLLYAQSPAEFAEMEPPADLVAKREKKAARAAKAAEPDEPAEAKPRKVNKAAQDKKVKLQREALDLLEKLLVDLASGGQWYEETHLERLSEQSKRLGDADLKAAMHVLNGLVVLGGTADLADEERLARGADLIGRLWATVQKGRNYLDGKLAGDESQAEADAVVEDVLGRVWKLTELQEKGYVKKDLALLELAYEHNDDQARRERVEVSHLLELNDGSIYQAVAYRPFKGMQYVAEQPSYTQPLTVAQAAYYPGFLNRRIRWDRAAEQVEELRPDHLERAYKTAKPEFKTVLEAFKQQMKHPLAPREAVVLLRCERLGRVGERLVLEDAAGQRLEAANPTADAVNLASLVRAAGMVGRERPALLVRLALRPVQNTIVAQPLAALTPACHLRLGL